jgi:cytoskeletal protein CcmA (bactofilin family)
MWKTRKDDEPHGVSSAPTPTAGVPVAASAPRPAASVRNACLGKSLFLKGEVSGAEDLFIDGEVEGSIELRDHVLSIGTNGRIRAEIKARCVIVQGTVNGNITSERVELKSSASVMGNIVTERIIMEDGAYLKGSVDVHKAVKPETHAEPKPAPQGPHERALAAKASAPAPSFSQASLLETKKA